MENNRSFLMESGAAAIDQDQIPSPYDENLDFDDDTLKAIAKVYLEEGDKEYGTNEPLNAIYFYTEGLQVNCKDDKLNAKLCTNRATAYFHLGNYQKALDDAAAAVKLEPTSTEAIETGASACVQLQSYEDAITWCDKGLSIEKNSKTLLDLYERCSGHQSKSQERKGPIMKNEHDTNITKGQTTTACVPKTSEEVADKADQGAWDVDNAIAHHNLEDLKDVIQYLGFDFGDLGNAYYSMGDFKKAIECHEDQLKIAKEMGDKAKEGKSYCNLGNAHRNLGDFKTAIEYHERHLKIAREEGDRLGEADAYGNLGNAYDSMGDFKKAIDYHEHDIKIAKEVGDRAREGGAYGNLGSAHCSLGDIKKAIEYHERHLKIAKEVQDRAGEGSAYGNLGNVYYRLGDVQKAIEYHERDLKIAKEVEDMVAEGAAYGNLGNAYRRLGDFQKAIEYYKRDLNVAKELGDRAGEGEAYGNLGTAYHDLGDFKKAMDYFKCHLKNATEVGDKAGEGTSYCNLGGAHFSMGDFIKAMENYERHLKIVTEVGDRAGEGVAYGNLGSVHHCLGDFKKAIKYHERHLKIAKEVEDKVGEGRAYGDLGRAYHNLGDFKKAIEYHECHLRFAKGVGDRADQGRSYGNIGNAYYSLGDFEKAIEYHERDLQIARDIGDRAGKGGAYCNLGNAYHSLGDFKRAIDYHECYLKIAKEVGDRAGEGGAYGNLGNSYQRLGDLKKAIEYHECHLKIAEEVGDRTGKGRAYGNIGNAYFSLGETKKAIEYHERDLKIAKEVGYKAEEARSFYRLGQCFELEDSPIKALECYQSSVRVFNDVRHHLLFEDEWKISYRHLYNCAYTSVWRLLLKQGEIAEALFAADQGRAQALQDLMTSKYASEASHQAKERSYDKFSFLPSNTVFMAFDKREIVFWIIQTGKELQLRRTKIGSNDLQDVATIVESLLQDARGKIGVKKDVKCEDRSLDRMSDKDQSTKWPEQRISQPTHFDSNNPLSALYDVIMGPISDLIHGSELIFVPEGPLCLVPYGALLDSDSNYLCEAFKIRVIPSLSSLKLIIDCSPEYHLTSGALLVGDPYLENVLYEGRKLLQLPCAKEEVEMIGEILHCAPLTGKEATEYEVLRRLPSVALVHIAAHGRMETGEIALAPNTTRASKTPNEEDFLLKMKDVLSVQLRARLVVLSCCHSGRGEIKAEGVVGIARAFLGAGARSVLVSLWAIDDEATMEFMKSFYSHLAERNSASEALNLAMKCMRDSEQFREVKYWAPFVLIGDDVTLDLDQGD